jgi:hypothetical protein
MTSVVSDFVGRKCHGAESGPMGSAQFAQVTEVQETTLKSTPRAAALRTGRYWALVGRKARAAARLG